ncbi:hypothetical protein P0136_12305 [Lentisphaerota bacterium ZTH]|nr:hypothetical protein JYG24_10180 [Lentisphaerota bacterium]WET06140.1 hypothetical protein P0136_12305 [Lentisphaerota bacterium ZTH]
MIRRKTLKILVLTAVCCTAALPLVAQIATNVDAGVFNPNQTPAIVNAPTPPSRRTQVLPLLKVDIDKKTEQVHFISTNNDPSVLTRVYVLKYADPYEILPYISAAISARRVSTSPTKAEAIKYMDGTGMIIVSAEDYRFGNTIVGMPLDELIRILDKPYLSVYAGRRYWLYFPKYWDALRLRDVIFNVGLYHANDFFELEGGQGIVNVDTGLNALFFYESPFAVKTVQRMLRLYDTPRPQALVKYKIYELNFENDGQVGADFQAWKNGPGTDLFAIAARYTNGWDFINENVGNFFVNTSNSRYVNFNPKWNTRYLDFLVTKSKAKILTTGQLLLMNNMLGTISAITSLARIQDGQPIPNQAVLQQYLNLQSVSWVSNNELNPNLGDYRLNNAIDPVNGHRIDVRDNAGGSLANVTLDFMSARSQVEGKFYFTLQIAPNSVNAVFFDLEANKSLGKNTNALNVDIQQYQVVDTANGTLGWVSLTDYSTDQEYVIERNVTRITKPGEYGFVLTMKPVVCNNATTLEINMSNTNLIGFKSNGRPRTSRSELKTQVIFNTNTRRFIIGGLEKMTVVRSVSKVPWLGSIPVLGWAFTTESEITKKSQLVAVIDCLPSPPDIQLPKKGIYNSIKEVKDDLKKHDSGIGTPAKNFYGFDQFLLDKSKKKLDAPP